MEPVGYYQLKDGANIPVFDPADVDDAFQFKLDGQVVAFMLAPPDEATFPQLRLKVGGQVMCPTDVDESQPASYTVQSVVWPSEVEATEEYTVYGTVENTSVGTGPETIEYRIGGATYATATVEADPGNEDDYEFQVTGPDVAGEYTQGVYTNDHQVTTALTVTGEPEWSVTSIDPVELTVTQGESFSVSGTLENTGTDSGDAEGRYYVGERHADTDTIPDLGVGESGTVEFSTTAAEDPGDYSHTIWTDHDGLQGTIHIERDTTMVDDFSHQQLDAYYQGHGVDNHSLADYWSEAGGWSLVTSVSEPGWMWSFPQANPSCAHSFSFDHYPSRGDTIRIVARVNDYNDTTYNENGHIFQFKFNAGSTNDDITYRHHMALRDPYHEFTDNHDGGYSSEPVPEVFEAGDVIEYVIQWHEDDTGTVWIERDGQKLAGEFSAGLHPEVDNAGFGISLKEEGGTSMAISHIEIED